VLPYATIEVETVPHGPAEHLVLRFIENHCISKELDRREWILPFDDLQILLPVVAFTPVDLHGYRQHHALRRLTVLVHPHLGKQRRAKPQVQLVNSRGTTRQRQGKQPEHGCHFLANAAADPIRLEDVEPKFLQNLCSIPVAEAHN
jgi:hypothetical protein